MRTIWTFGDSFTNGDGCIETQGIRDGDTKYYYEYKKIEDDIWPTLLSKKTSCDIKNMGKSGASNDYIIDSIIDNFDNILENDIVIIEKTFYQRFDIPNLNKNVFHTQYGESLYTMDIDLKNNKYDKNKLEIETILNYGILFANHKLFKERQFKRFNFIKNQLKNKKAIVFIWDIEDFRNGNVERIIEHTNGKIKDFHFSFNGHRQFSDFLFNSIFQEKTLI